MITQNRQTLERKLTRRFGLKILHDMELLKTQYSLTMARLAKRYGVSRQYISLIFKGLNDKPYEIYRKLKAEKAINEANSIGCNFDPRQKSYLCSKSRKPSYKRKVEFMNKCISHGVNVDLPDKTGLTLYANGYSVLVIVDVRRPSAKDPYHRYANLPKDIASSDIDFVACYHSTRKSFFIVPVNKIELNSSTLYIRKYKSTYHACKNAYFEFEEKWDQFEANLENHKAAVGRS